MSFWALFTRKLNTEQEKRKEEAEISSSTRINHRADASQARGRYLASARGPRYVPMKLYHISYAALTICGDTVSYVHDSQ
jgi:hypothetical protein